MFEEPDEIVRTQPRSTVKVVGGLLAFVFVSLFALVTCVRAYVDSVPPRTVRVLRTDITAELPRFVPITDFGADGQHTHGLWVTLHADGTALAVSSRGPERGCFVAYQLDQSLYRDSCTGAIYGRDGLPLSGDTTRALDRFDAAVDPAGITVDLERTMLGLCRGDANMGCSPPGDPVYRPTQ
jgi:hypothetical protein